MADREPVTFSAIAQAPNLRSGLADTLAAQIESGNLAPGQRLPTEQEIVVATGVSRTVVREALASLRARGLVTTRQGLGAFVAQTLPPKSFTIAPDDLASVDEVLRVLELRMGVEVEAAGLAAERRKISDLDAMAAALAALSEAIRDGDAGSQEDFAFHRAIISATRNANFMQLFDIFGSVMIPRQWTRVDRMSMSERERHTVMIGREHEAILIAIEAKDVNGARRAMRVHLTKAYNRFAGMREKANCDA